MLSKKQTQKYKIVLEIPFGPCKTAADASNMKKGLKVRTPNITFSALTKTSSGYIFKGRFSYVKSLAAPASVIKEALVNRTGAKVRVTRV